MIRNFEKEILDIDKKRDIHLREYGILGRKRQILVLEKEILDIIIEQGGDNV